MKTKYKADNGKIHHLTIIGGVWSIHYKIKSVKPAQNNQSMLLNVLETFQPLNLSLNIPTLETELNFSFYQTPFATLERSF